MTDFKRYLQTVFTYVYIYFPMIALAGIIPSLFVTVYPHLSDIPYNDLLEMASPLMQVIAQILGIYFIWYLLGDKIKTDIKDLKDDKQKYQKIIIAFVAVFIITTVGTALLMGIVSFFVVNILGNADFAFPTNSVNQESILLNFKSEYLLVSIPMFVLAIVTAPIFEELIFRLGFIGLFMNHKSKIVGYVASALIFAGIHVALNDDWISIIPYLVSGGLFVGIYVYFKHNIMYSIIIHMLWNILATITSLSFQ